MQAITAEHLNRRFKDFVAVKDVSFSVEEGELFGFLGPNGAGKTTTINMLCTLLKPSGGAAHVNGFDVRDQTSDVRRSIGLVFQDTTLDDYLSAEQNLRFHADAYAVPKSVYLPRMKSLLELLELWDRRKDTTRNYSGGMKRRLEIARGLLHHPKILFLDEPTIGLDPQTRRHIWDHLRELRRNDNLTIFLTTHYMDEAEYCDRIAIIDHGEIVALDTPDNLKASVGGDIVKLKAPDNQALIKELNECHGIEARIEDDEVTFTVAGGKEWLPRFVRESTQALQALTLRGPTLEDVFIKITGHAIRAESADTMAGIRRWRQSGNGGRRR
jgi:ABC-2 type transport system ATP-binding protein